ncbi:MAG: hypothetical protein ACTSUO_10195 [Candidatus Thorarchaeota archaeon]
MISGKKAQNVIVIVMLVLGLFSGINLIGSATEYSGSYLIASYLHVELDEIRLTNYDPENVSINPGLYLDFSFQAPTTIAGQATITFLKAAVFLNGDHISYAVFARSIPEDQRLMTSGYNASFTLSSGITAIEDKWTLLNATADGEWVYSVRLTYFYYIFDARADSVRQINFAYTAE